MTSQEPSQNIDPIALDTEVIAVPVPAPVFVDSTGRRSRLLRHLALAFGVVLIGYAGLVSLSLAGGPISSSAVLPLPGLDDEDDERSRTESTPVPTPEPRTSTTPAGRAAEPANREPQARRPVAVTSTTRPSVAPSRSASPKPVVSKSATPPDTKPVESATVSTSPSVSSSPSTPADTPDPAVR